jgi:hypothetical protein
VAKEKEFLCRQSRRCWLSSAPAQLTDPTASLAACQSPMAYRVHEALICRARGQRLELPPSMLAALHGKNRLTKRSRSHNEDARHHQAEKQGLHDWVEHRGFESWLERCSLDRLLI